MDHNNHDDYSNMSVYDIVKLVVEEYTGLPIEQNVHVQITMMWRMAEVIEDGEVELFDGTNMDYNLKQDTNKNELVDLCFDMIAKFSTYLTFTGKPASVKNEFKNVEGEVTKSNK